MAGRPRSLGPLLAIAFATMLAAGCASPGAPEAEAGRSVEGSRSFSGVITDQRLRGRIQGFILQDDELLRESNVSVTVFNRVVLLTGEVSDAPAGRRLAAFARDQREVEQVYNELVVAPLSSVMSRSRDRMISTSAGARMLTLDDAPDSFDADRIKIVTERQRIYLLGRVTRDEADAVTESLRRIRGVREVVRMFQYID
ncbi:MAG: BON domain-containing protein [Ectothiorhodospiraceae bacterium]|nr:BON domain-containing protein [Ectothiorhodospiraceae bacterium]MCH8503835.1 BON domain-containing protein [Ectothiorhodospiraceae bacterium]